VSDRVNRGSYWVYILTNKRNGTLYVGITNSLKRRIWQHKTKSIEGFTKQYGVDQLVFFEEFRDVSHAIGREKAIKGWTRKRKLALIETDNPQWADLSAGWNDIPLDSSLRSE
jgi:putative endonuclease